LKPTAWGSSVRSSELPVTIARAVGDMIAPGVFKRATAFIAACLCAAAPAAVAQTAADTAPQTVIEFTHAEFVHIPAADGKTLSAPPPPQNAHWQEVSLPDSWRQSQRPRRNHGWYRIQFNVAADATYQRAVYIPRITNNVEVFLNGTSFAVSGQLGPEPTSAWNFAQYYLLPAGLLKPGNNELLIRLHPDGYPRAGLSRITLGEAEAVRAKFEYRYFFQTAAPKFITILLALVAVFSLSIWWKRRNESMFGFFSLMLAVAIVRLVHYYLPMTPLWLAYLAVPSICWLTVLQVQFALRYAGQPLPRFERLLVGLAAISTIALFVVPERWYGLATSSIYGIFAILSPVILFVVGRVLFRNITGENMLMLLALLVNTALGVHDFIAYQEKLGFDRLYLLPLGLPLLLLAVAALLVKRFVETLAGYEKLNTELVHRVADRERELTVSYEKLRTLDQQRATAEERQQLMRDMHDGIGSHLMSTLALARMGTLTQHAMQEILADCIDELKITIDSLEPVESDLLVVLGNLRYRLEPRLNAAGISLEWAVNDLPPLAYLDPENTRSILRIVQEAFTNTLKHAGAKRITLSTGVDYANARVIVRLTDDGVGFKSGQPAGRGVENMKNRAAKLNGDVEVLPLKGGGTCVNLYLPMAKVV
jgi:signal transduction histidine kinase